MRRAGEPADCVACCSGGGAGEGTRGKEDPTMKRGAAALRPPHCVCPLPRAMAEPPRETKLQGTHHSQRTALSVTHTTITQVPQILGSHTHTTPSHPTPASQSHTHYTTPSPNPTDTRKHEEMECTPLPHSITPQQNHNHEVPCRRTHTLGTLHQKHIHHTCHQTWPCSVSRTAPKPCNPRP